MLSNNGLFIVLTSKSRKTSRDLRQKQVISKVLILDDSTLAKTGRKIEGVSRVHDHVTNSYPIGYKLLGLTWFNGYYGRFLDFCFSDRKTVKTEKKQEAVPQETGEEVTGSYPQIGTQEG